jgi:hypothetical protein
MKVAENKMIVNKKLIVKINNKEILVMFFIQPFIAFLFAITQLKRKHSFAVIFLFFVLFGFTFIAQNESADSYRYVGEFNRYTHINSNQFSNDIKDFFTFESNIKDIYVLTSYYIVSRITDNYHILMALWAIVFSFFYLKAFRFFVDCPEFKKSLIVSLLTFLFLLSNNIFNINGVRFWTAAWVAVYVVFEVIINKNYKYVALSLILPLIHTSYLFFLLVLAIYLLTRKFDKIWVVLFVASFFVSEISIQLFQNYQDYLPQGMQNLIWSYTADENLADRQNAVENLPLYARILNSLPRFFLNLLMFVFIYNHKRIRLFKMENVIFVFLLIWMSFVNFTMAIPSFGGRFIILAVPFICYQSLLTYKYIPILPKLIYLIPIVYSYTILDWFRNMITVTDPYLLLSVFPHIVIKNLLL